MGLPTFLEIVVEDFQGYEATLPFRIVDADYGATALPTQAHVLAIISAVFGDGKFSDSIVKYIQFVIKDVSFAGGGGLGNTPTSEALRYRNSVNTSHEYLTRVPGVSKANLLFDPQNPNGVSTSGALWTALRSALTAADIAVADPEGAYSATPSGEIAEVANVFDGRRAPLRPR